MPFRKILLMQSVEDAITQKRKQKIASHPMVQDCEFVDCYAVELTNEQKALPIPFMIEDVARGTLDADGLARRLICQVSAFKPDLLLVHPGFVFRVFTNEIIAALRSVKAKFPNLKFGLLNSEDPLAHIPDTGSFFDDDAEIRMLVEQISTPRQPMLPGAPSDGT